MDLSNSITIWLEFSYFLFSDFVSTTFGAFIYSTMAKNTKMKELQANNKKQADALAKLGHYTLAKFGRIDNQIEHLEGNLEQFEARFD